MPMPPPRPTNEPQLNQRRRREFEQLERALRDKGPSDTDTLRSLVGGSYWQADRFDKALTWGVQKKLLVRGDDGRFHLASKET